MEDALALATKEGVNISIKCLNPCCNGRCTRTYYTQAQFAMNIPVLILVVMEDALAH